jgi:hypothetical protein
MCKSTAVGESWGAHLGDIGLLRGNIKMNPDETNFSGNWNGFDLVQRSLASFVKGEESSAPLKTWNFYNCFLTVNLSVLHDSGRNFFAKNLIKTNNTIR